MTDTDALIFDMDGTLWDAIDSYCAVWNATAADCGAVLDVRYDDLLPLMGRPLADIYDKLAGGCDVDRERFMYMLEHNEREMMPRLGGRLYPGVRETLVGLRTHGLRLMMVSNCSARGLDNFMSYTGLGPLFDDTLTYGETGCDKDVNLRTLAMRYNMRRPLYVGDIQRDADSTHRAGMEFVWASYGFGHVADADYKIDKFSDLTDLIYGK